MCHQEGRTVFHHVAGRFLNFFLGGRIQRARGLIEYDDLRLTNQCPGDGNSLTLTAGKLIPVFSQLRIDAIRKLFDHILQSDILYDLHHFLFRHMFQTVSDIVQNRSGKQDCILRHDCDLMTVFIDIQIDHIDAVDQDLSADRRDKADQQVQNRRFSGTRFSHQRNALPRLYIQSEIAQRIFIAARIFKIHIDKFYCAL